MIKLLHSYLRDQTGATMVEYGIFVAAIGLAILATVFVLGGGLSDVYQEVSTAIEDEMGSQ